MQLMLPASGWKWALPLFISALIPVQLSLHQKLLISIQAMKPHLVRCVRLNLQIKKKSLFWGVGLTGLVRASNLITVVCMRPMRLQMQGMKPLW